MKKVKKTVMCFLVALLFLLSGCAKSETRISREPLPEGTKVQKSGFGFLEKDASTGPGAKLLGGGRLTLLANQTASQMLSAVIETPQGSLIVVDGGTPEDSGHLLDTIRAKGGRVAAWLITHPHSDHVGALNTILNDANSQIAIDHIYYSFTDLAWYYEHESYRAQMVDSLMQTFSRLPGDMLRGNIQKGQQILVDKVKITVLNLPYLFSNNAINNSSVAYSIEMNGRKIVFLGDMGSEAGAQFKAETNLEKLGCDILQMAHHGQYGVERDVYQALNPKICLWPTPEWLWNNDNGSGPGSGPWITPQTREWMDEMGVKAHYCIKDGDQILE